MYNSTMMMRILFLLSTFAFSEAFLSPSFQKQHGRTSLHSSSKVFSTRRQIQEATEVRRKVLLSRNGPHFRLDRMGGQVEFGATANLVTQLERQANAESIATWLEDERGLALSIWDEKLTRDMGNSIYRLQVMSLQFVTLQLAPWVDLRMKSIPDGNGSPVFSLQSVNFDPNIQVLPGMRVSADALGIVIEVVGELRPTKDGKGVIGDIAFQTSGKLPPPMRLLPEPALKAASDTINKTIVNFAIQSFQRGATAKYRDFLKKQPSNESSV